MTVSLTKRVKTSNGMRYCQVVTAANGRIAQDMVLINGKAERHSEGAYYIEWHVKGIRKRKSVGNNATDAAAAKHKQEQLLNARAVGLTVVEDKKGRSLVNAAAAYLSEIEAQKKHATYKAYRYAINYFIESCSKTTLEELDRTDMLNFITFLRKRFAPYSVYTRFLDVMVFLKTQGVPKLIANNEWPKFTQTEPETYEQAELLQFFAACTTDERLLFEFFFQTGMRDKEVAHATWRSVNFVQGTISVRPNTQYEWTSKTYREREIPVPQSLITALKAARKSGDANDDLLFPADCGKPKFFIEGCKEIAERAGMNPKDWWLHKFRATFATMHLWDGVDLRTVMNWMGHKNIASTMRYLKPNRGLAVRAKVESTFSFLTSPQCA